MYGHTHEHRHTHTGTQAGVDSQIIQKNIEIKTDGKIVIKNKILLDLVKYFSIEVEKISQE